VYLIPFFLDYQLEQSSFTKIQKIVDKLFNGLLVFSLTTGIGLGILNAIAAYNQPQREFLYKSEYFLTAVQYIKSSIKFNLF
jgi:uncharacterized membrane protein SirB2